MCLEKHKPQGKELTYHRASEKQGTWTYLELQRSWVRWGLNLVGKLKSSHVVAGPTGQHYELTQPVTHHRPCQAPPLPINSPTREQKFTLQRNWTGETLDKGMPGSAEIRREAQGWKQGDHGLSQVKSSVGIPRMPITRHIMGQRLPDLAFGNPPKKSWLVTWWPFCWQSHTKTSNQPVSTSLLNVNG